MFALDAPEPKRSSRRGLLSVANVIRGANPYALYESQKIRAGLQGTNRAVPTDGSEKVFDKRPEDIETVLFQQYRGIDLSLMEGPGAGQQILQRLFEDGESYAVEDAVQELLLNPDAVDITPTPGTPVKNLKHALGLLEQYAADNYTGEPIISGNLFATLLIPELQAKPDGSLETVLGTPIAAAAGYGAEGPGAASAAAGTAWLYITGQINIWESPVALHSGPALEKNRELTLAEKAYAASLDGFAAAILVGI
ncbi:hypothetical protein SEA_ODYSSEY395_29 [Arthrobacter phage Odyssey395]|nr:hypothetical protein SEA_ODYSSEY395_29 [Arthrobacter phage Odyssey395]